MREQPAEPYAGKVSQEFAARLERLAPDETIRAIVLPMVARVRNSNRGRTDEIQRAAAIAETEAVLLRLFKVIDAQLAETVGRRVTDKPNALGYVVVETSRSGIAKLTQLDGIRAVIEDQPLHRIHTRSDDQANQR